MGQAKNEWIRTLERGFELLDGHVCINCIKDVFLKEMHAEVSEEGACDYCDETSVQVARAEFIQTQIMDSLLSEYQNIEDAGAIFISREGGWQLNHDTAQEIIGNEICVAVEEAFGEAIVHAVDLSISWCERDWTILSPIARMSHGWKQFCRVVKDQLRFSFMFAESDEDPEHPDYTHPGLTLREIGNLVGKLNLVRELPVGTPFYRVRLDSSARFSTLNQLGCTLPANSSSNRMSPAGIPMLYTSETVTTAISETWDGQTSAVASVATFHTTQPLQIIDFTYLPSQPSFWSNPGREVMGEFNFLHLLTADLSKPVNRGSKVDLHYAPTQIVSEYLTKAWRGLPRSWNPPSNLVHGLAFKSSKTGNKNYGLNLLQEVDPMYGLKQDDFIELVAVDYLQLHPGQAPLPMEEPPEPAS